MKSLRSRAESVAVPVIVHSDLSRAVAVSRELGFRVQRENLVESLLATFEKLAGVQKQSMVFPAFNYGFGSSRVFDVEEDPIQVGALPEMLRRSGFFRRTSVPFFSFLHMGFDILVDFDLIDPFGMGSMFDLVEQSSGSILMVGTGLEAFTYIHHIESRLPGGPTYRYRKSFTGSVQIAGKEFPCVVEMHVRPEGVSLEYDWHRLESELFEAGALQYLGLTGQVIVVSAKRAKDYLVDKMLNNPLHLLTRKTQSVVMELLVGRERLTLEQFE